MTILEGGTQTWVFFKMPQVIYVTEIENYTSYSIHHQLCDLRQDT